MDSTRASPYRVRQLGRPDSHGHQRNEGVEDLESLTTHHPKRNMMASLVDGLPNRAENIRRRSYGVIGGEFQELQTIRTDWSYNSLGPHQVLLIKDFILDDTTAADSRRVDVPSPVAGVIGRVDARNGVVDINAPADNRLIARMRHLGPIAVAVGDTVAYGQSLGTQNNIGLPGTAGKHVHIEMDTGHYQQLDHYIRDLVDGRLAVQAAHREGVQPRPVVDDGVARVGESGERVAAVQHALVAGGYRAVGGAEIVADGVYRLSLQGAVLRFQQDHGLAQSGDICPDTWRTALDLTLGMRILPPPAVDPAPEASPPRAHEHLLERIRGHVGALDAAHGRAPDADSERLARGVLHLATDRGLRSVDHVLLSAATADAPAGALVFVVEGGLDDPAQRRVALPTAEAMAWGANGPAVGAQARELAQAHERAGPAHGPQQTHEAQHAMRGV